MTRWRIVLDRPADPAGVIDLMAAADLGGGFETHLVIDDRDDADVRNAVTEAASKHGFTLERISGSPAER